MIDNKKVNVNGVAIRAGISRNKIFYEKDELAKFAPTLKDRPILKDHEAKTDNTIGLVTDTFFNAIDNSISYMGWVKEDGSGITERIEDRRIKEVSIGAIVGRLVKESDDDDYMIAKDMVGLELSTTPTPGVVGTSINQSLDSNSPIIEKVELFNEFTKPEKKEEIIIENISTDEKSVNDNSIKEETKMVEETKIDVQSLVEEEVTKRLKVIEEKKQEEIRIAREKELQDENKRLKEEIAKKVETPKIVEDKTVGKVAKEIVDDKIDSELKGYNVERSKTGKFSLYTEDYSKLNNYRR